jgi:threonine aldolase
MSFRRRILDALMYAIVTAGVIIGIALLLSQSSVQARTLAYQEIHEHRLAFTCYAAEMTASMNDLLEGHGLPLMAEPDTNGIACDELDIPDESDIEQ